MSALRAAAIAALVATTAAYEATAQASPSAVTIHTIPLVPVRGSLAWLVVRSADATKMVLGVEGEAAEEPLHFESRGKSYRALVGVPLEGDDSLTVTLRVARAATADTLQVVLAVATPSYPTERLTVAPRFAKLDSVTSERVDSEVSEARAAGRAAHATTRLWSGRFAAPRPGRVTSVFGTGREFNGEVTSRHYGTDFAGRIGAPVRAAGRGVVALVADFYLAGRAVYLNHGDGVMTGYFHLSRVDVAVGDTVAKGQVIGGVGKSGRATRSHLHWIARYGAITVDPMSLLRLAP